MSLKDQNIEEMFRTELEDLELPVDNSVWANISNGIAAQSAVTTTTITATKVLAYLGIGTAAVAIGVAVGLYITSNDSLKTENENTIQTTQSEERNDLITVAPVQPVITEDQNLVQEIVKPSILENDKAITKEEQIEQPRQVIVKTAKNDQGNVMDGRNNSWVNNFLTPSKSAAKGLSNVDEVVVTNEESLVSEPVQVPDTIIEQVAKDVIIADIVAVPIGGFAPLEVSFAHKSEVGTVTWEFGDGETSTSANPTHIFEKYGNYKVKLTIEDEDGNTFEDFRLIEVEANSALTKIPNIITPNDDGENDIFTIQAKNLKTFHLVVLSPKGELIFESKDIANSWDGTNVGGEKVVAGSYAVLISAQGIDGKKYKHNEIVKVQY